MMRRAVGALALAALAIGATPEVAFADAAGPTDYSSEIVSITPATDSITVTVEGGDSFLHLEVAAGHEAIVLGYAPDQEPYLRIRSDGTVEQNIRSYATYYNEERFGRDDIPDVVDTTAAPEWEQIGSGGSWAWHDHRAHWMDTAPPIGLEPGDSLPAQIVPLVVDGEPVEVHVVTTLHASPSIWPVVFGLLVGLQLVLLGLLLGPATTILSALLLALGALIVGGAQFRSLPSETGPLLTWWLLPAVALACAITAIATYGRSALLRTGLVAIASAQLIVWGFGRRDGVTAAVLPTDLPFWFDRAMTSAVLVGSIGLLVVTFRQMFEESPASA